MGKSEKPRRKKPADAAFAAGTLGLADQLRRDVAGQWTDNRIEQANHYRGVIYVAIRAIMDAVLSSTVQLNRKHRKYASVSLRRLEKALPTPSAHSQDEQFRPFDDPDHSLVKLLDQPNRTETFNELLAQLVLQYHLTGSGLLWGNPNDLGLPAELYVLPTALCYPQPASPEWPEGWWRVTQFYPSGGYGLLPSPMAGGGAPVDARDIFQFKNPHPLWRWDAMSPLTAGAVQLDILESIDQARWTAMDMGLTPDMVLLAPGVNQSQLDVYLERLKQTNIGKRNHRKVMAIGGDQGDSKFDVKFPSATAKDMDFSAGWDQMTAFALALFGVPKSVAGLATTGSYAELYAAIKQFHSLTLRPMVARLGTWLTRHLARIWGDDLAIQLDLPTIDDQQLQETQLATDLAHDGLTYNEYRAIRGRKPVPGGDVLCSVYVQQQQAEAQAAMQAMMPQPQQAGGPPGQPPPGGVQQAAGEPDDQGQDPQQAQGGAPGDQEQGDPLSQLLGTAEPGSGDQHVQDAVGQQALAALGVPAQAPGGFTKAYEAIFWKAGGPTRRTPPGGTGIGGTRTGTKPGKRVPSSSSALPKSRLDDRRADVAEQFATASGKLFQATSTGAAPAPKPRSVVPPMKFAGGMFRKAVPAPRSARQPDPVGRASTAGPMQPRPSQPPPVGAVGDEIPVADREVPEKAVPVRPPERPPAREPFTGELDHEAGQKWWLGLSQQERMGVAQHVHGVRTGEPGALPKMSNPDDHEIVQALADHAFDTGEMAPWMAPWVPNREGFQKTPTSAAYRARLAATAKESMGLGPPPTTQDLLQQLASHPGVAKINPMLANAKVLASLPEQEVWNIAGQVGLVKPGSKPAAAPQQPKSPAPQQPKSPAPQQPPAPNAPAPAAVPQSVPQGPPRTVMPTGPGIGLNLPKGTPVMGAGNSNPPSILAPGRGAKIDGSPPEPVGDRGTIAAAASAGQMPPAEVFEPHAAPLAQLAAVSPQFHATLSKVKQWAAQHAQQHAEQVAEHFNIEPERAIELLTHTYQALAAHATNKVLGGATPEQALASSSATQTQASTGQNITARFGPKVTAARKLIAEMAEHMRGGHDMKDVEAAKTAHAIDHLPPDEVKRTANNLDHNMTAGEARTKNTLIAEAKRHAKAAAAAAITGSLAAGADAAAGPLSGMSPAGGPPVPAMVAPAPQRPSPGNPWAPPNVRGEASVTGPAAPAPAAEQPPAGPQTSAPNVTQPPQQSKPGPRPMETGGDAADLKTLQAARADLQARGMPTGTVDAQIAAATPLKATAPDHYNPDVEKVGPNGVTLAARVGVHAHDVPNDVKPVPNLNPEERAVETQFRNAYKADPDGMAGRFLALVHKVAAKNGDVPTFGTDDAKLLSPHWSSPELDADTERRGHNRAKFNVALHQVANAVTKRAFLRHLDTLAPGQKVLVTNGGVGAGKGYSLEVDPATGQPRVPEAAALKGQAAAVWDSAGDQNATENEWIQKELEKRGLKGMYMYVHADPKVSWADKGRGVVKRAQNHKKDGRMVDAHVFADSYALGARNHQKFHEANKNNPDAEFVYTSNGKLIPGMPPEALNLDRHELARWAIKALHDSDAPEHIKHGGSVGTRIWGYPGGQAREFARDYVARLRARRDERMWAGKSVKDIDAEIAHWLASAEPPAESPVAQPGSSPAAKRALVKNVPAPVKNVGNNKGPAQKRRFPVPKNDRVKKAVDPEPEPGGDEP